MFSKLCTRFFFFVMLFSMFVLAACGEATENTGPVADEVPVAETPLGTETVVVAPVEDETATSTTTAPEAEEVPVPSTIIPSSTPAPTNTPKPVTTLEGFLREGTSYSTGMEIMVAIYSGPSNEGHYFDIFDGEGLVPSEVTVVNSYIFDAKVWGGQAQMDKLFRCAVAEVARQDDFFTCLMATNATSEVMTETPEAAKTALATMPVCYVAQGKADVQVRVSQGTIDIITLSSGGFTYESSNFEVTTPTNVYLNQEDGCFYTVLQIPAGMSSVNFVVTNIANGSTMWDQDLWLK